MHKHNNNNNKSSCAVNIDSSTLNVNLSTVENSKYFMTYRFKYWIVFREYVHCLPSIIFKDRDHSFPQMSLTGQHPHMIRMRNSRRPRKCKTNLKKRYKMPVMFSTGSINNSHQSGIEESCDVCYHLVVSKTPWMNHCILMPRMDQFFK